MSADLSEYPASQSSRPYTRWWWLNGPFREQDIRYQLDWLSANGFGGVELAWLEPTWQGGASEESRPAWLGEELAERLAYAKRYADQLGLGCDLTFGSGRPIGGSSVAPQDAAQTLDGPSGQRLYGSWESGPRLVLDHLSSSALRHYAETLAPAFEAALAGTPSALFCDSLELEAGRLWSPALWDQFEARFGYRLEERTELARTHPQMRYEYRRLVGAVMQQAFFETYAAVCRELGAVSRVQCHGVPVDLLAAYASVNVPESETLLYDPHFSRIAASAAVLAGKPLVSAEAFSCIYGFVGLGNIRPVRYWRREQVADLKLLADAILANGVNQIVWHGMPYNPPGGKNEFFASVHVGPDAAFARDLPDFNEYLETVSGMLRRGRPYTSLAVYLPYEDMLVRDRVAEENRTPGANYEWEMRQVRVPPETEGHHPVWVSETFLRKAEVEDGEIEIGHARFAALYLDCEWLDAAALEELVRLARDGATIVMKRPPALPGMRRHPHYAEWLAELAGSPNVRGELAAHRLKPLVEGENLPYFWARQGERELVIFFAHPLAREVRYPMAYGQSYCDGPVDRTVTINYGDASRQVPLRFEPYQSILLRIGQDGEIGVLDVDYYPVPPVRDPEP
jgi:hypothetical protein